MGIINQLITGGAPPCTHQMSKKKVVSNYKRSDQQDPGGANSHLQNGKSRIQLMEVRKRTICLAIWIVGIFPEIQALYMVGTSNESVPEMVVDLHN